MKLNALLKTYYPALLILVILILFSLFAFHQTNVAIASRRSKLFELRVQRVTETLHKRILDYAQILKGCQAMIYASDSVTAEEWRIYTDNLNVPSKYPGIQAVAYAAYIPKRQKDKLEALIQQSGYPEFKIKSTFKNDYLTPIIYIEPFKDRNLRAFGFDMYSEANRREAMDRAMLTGEAAMTGKVKLVQETNVNIQPGFLLYLPVYKNPQQTKTLEDRKRNIRGFVYNPFRAHDFMRTILTGFDDISIEIYDGDKINRLHLLFDSDSATQIGKNVKEQAEFRSDTSVHIAGAEWKVNVFSRQGFGSGIENWQPYLVLFLGLSISILMFVMAVTFIRRRLEVVDELNIIKELENKKDEFIGIASHELKTPLTGIKAYLQLLERSDLNDKEKVFVKKASSQIRKLSHLIGDLLDVTKIKAGKLQLNISPFSLQELIDESIESVQNLHSSHEIVKVSEVPHLLINGDKFRLEQAVTNILMNAVKYSPGAQKVLVNTVKLPDRIRIEIIDEGIGISEDQQKQIFEKFYRSEDLSPMLSGLGMGLYISHEIIRRHHGEISVKSEPGRGSVFAIELPLKEIHHKGAQAVHHLNNY